MALIFFLPTEEEFIPHGEGAGGRSHPSLSQTSSHTLIWAEQSILFSRIAVQVNLLQIS